MKHYYPQADKTYTQYDRGNILSNTWSSFNLDIQENPGALRISPRMQILTKTGDTNATNMGCPIGFKGFGGAYWTIAGTRVMTNGSNGGLANSAFVEDSVGTASTDYNPDYSDIEVFNGLLWVTAPSKLRSGTGAAWTDRETFGTTTVPHLLNKFVKLNRLYFSITGNTIGSIDTAHVTALTGDYSLTLDSTFSIAAIRSTNQSIWIACISNSNPAGYGVVFEWDGISAQPTSRIELKARGGIALVILDGIPHVMDSNGILSKFNGTSFVEVARIPNKGRLTNSVVSSNTRFIHPNGLGVTKNNTILALINNLNADSGGTIDENVPSGVWEYAEGNGFIHKKPLTYNVYNTATITDFGQNRISRAGGIAIANDSSTSGLVTIMLGATYFTDASTTTNGIFIENTIDTIQKKGYFVTTWIESGEIESTWDRFWAVYRRFLASTDSIVPKIRLSEESATDATITWVNTTSFTTTTDVTAYGPTASGFNGTIGGEVEITQGTGSGSTAHITAISEAGGTYTVTIDTVITGVTTGTAKARFQKWIKLFPAKAQDQVKSYSQWSIGKTDTRIQLKCFFTYTGAGEFYKSIIVSNEDIKALG